MQEYITEETLKELDVDLTNEDVPALLTHLNDMLEERVGMALTSTLDETQLQALLDIQETASEEEIGEWLATNVPEFEEIIHQETISLLDEVLEADDEDKTV